MPADATAKGGICIMMRYDRCVRTTVSLDSDVVAAVQAVRAEKGLGLSLSRPAEQSGGDEPAHDGVGEQSAPGGEHRAVRDTGVEQALLPSPGGRNPAGRVEHVER